MMKEGEDRERKASLGVDENPGSSSTIVTATVFQTETKAKDLEKQDQG